MLNQNFPAPDESVEQILFKQCFQFENPKWSKSSNRVKNRSLDFEAIRFEFIIILTQKNAEQSLNGRSSWFAAGV